MLTEYSDYDITKQLAADFISYFEIIFLCIYDDQNLLEEHKIISKRKKKKIVTYIISKLVSLQIIYGVVIKYELFSHSCTAAIKEFIILGPN